MPTSASQREAVAVFLDPDALRSAADALMLQGFDRANLSVLSSNQSVLERVLSTKTVANLEDDPTAPSAAYASGDSLTELKAAIIGVPFFIGAASAGGAIVANGGTLQNAGLGALIAGAVAGVLGAIVAWWLGRQHDAYLKAQLGRGGLLLWVRTLDPQQEERACRILTENKATDVHLHDVPGSELQYTSRPGKVVYGLLEFLAGVRPPAEG